MENNNLEEKLGALLSNPEMMQKIQAMAQALGQPSPQNPPTQKQPEQKPPEIDLSLLQKFSSLAGQTGIDKNQQTLLAALTPYLSRTKVEKLENAMRAARMARLASSFLGNGGLQTLIGR